MSHSFKKNPVEKTGFGTAGKKLQKKLANKKVRMATEVPGNGGAYKKLHERYLIDETRTFFTESLQEELELDYVEILGLYMK
jgi:hypothetical protein